MECERQALATQTERFYFSPQKKLEFLLGLPLDISWELVLDDVNNLSLKVGVIDRYDSTPNGAEPNDVDYSVLLLWSL